MNVLRCKTNGILIIFSVFCAFIYAWISFLCPLVLKSSFKINIEYGLSDYAYKYLEDRLRSIDFDNYNQEQLSALLKKEMAYIRNVSLNYNKLLSTNIFVSIYRPVLIVDFINNKEQIYNQLVDKYGLKKCLQDNKQDNKGDHGADNNLALKENILEKQVLHPTSGKQVFNKYVIIKNGKAIPACYFNNQMLEGLYSIDTAENIDNSENSDDFCKCALNLDTNIFDKYNIAWLDSTQIILKNKLDLKFILVADRLSIKEMDRIEFAEKIYKSKRNNYKTGIKIDIRFRDYIIFVPF